MNPLRRTPHVMARSVIRHLAVTTSIVLFDLGNVVATWDTSPRLAEYARASGTFAARWEQVKITFLAGTLILLGVTAAVLAALFIIVIILPEIWRPLLVVVAVFAVLVFLVFRRNRPTR